MAAAVFRRHMQERHLSHFALLDKCLLLLTSKLPPLEKLERPLLQTQEWVKTQEESTKYDGCQRYAYELQGMQLVWKSSKDLEGVTAHPPITAPLELKVVVWAQSLQEAQDKVLAAAITHLEHLGVLTNTSGYPELAVEPLDIPAFGAGRDSYGEECTFIVPSESWESRPVTIVNTYEGLKQSVREIMELLSKADGPANLNSYNARGLPKRFLKYLIGYDQEFSFAEFLGRMVVALVQMYVCGRFYVIQIWPCMKNRFGTCNAKNLSLTLQCNSEMVSIVAELQELRPILEAAWIKKCGVGLWNDLVILQRCAFDHTFKFGGLVQLEDIADGAGFRIRGLNELCALLLGHTVLNYRESKVPWNSNELDQESLRYAMDDAGASGGIAYRLLPAIVQQGEYECKPITPWPTEAKASSSLIPPQQKQDTKPQEKRRLRSSGANKGKQGHRKKRRH